MTTEIDLQKFDPEHWVESGFRYGTDGTIVIRVPAPGKPDSEVKRPWVSELPWDATSGIKSPYPEGGEVVLETKICCHCDGYGRVNRVKCSECDGAGEIECCECGNCEVCEDCEDGFTGGDLCPVCKGECWAKVPTFIRILPGFSIGAKYHELIKTLPNVQICPVVKNYVLPFTFDGGEGLVAIWKNG